MADGVRKVVGEAESGRAQALWDGVAIGRAEFVDRMKDLAGRPDRETAGCAKMRPCGEACYKRLCNMLNMEM